MSNLLTDEELQRLCGLKQAAAQIRWLQKWSVKHFVTALGEPRVTWSAIEGAESPKKRPNLSAIRQAG